MDKEDYKVRYHAKLPTTTKPDFYNEDITNNTTDVVWSKAEAVHAAKTADYQLFAAAKREIQYFILAVVEDNWVRELREPVTLYTSVSPSEPLSHLQVLCGGLHALGVPESQN